MQLKHVKYFQRIAGVAICIFFVVAGFLEVFFRSPLEQGKIEAKKRELPRSSFYLPLEAYGMIAEKGLQLKTSPPKLRPPDLRAHLLYHGQNGRPDACIECPKMHFSIQSGKSFASAKPFEKIYLAYDKKLTTHCKYQFSKDNAPTMMWIVAEPSNSETEITLCMQDIDGVEIESTDPGSKFNLPEKELVRSTNQGSWEIGKWRVDGTLLARQKARWIGVDRFIEEHGGEDFQEESGKHRIDFGDGDEIYSVFVKPSDCLIWDEERWRPAPKDSSTLDKPLLVVKKIEDRVMTLDLWDVSGKGKVALTMIRSQESFRPEDVISDFRFVGARTKTQVVFQVDEERVIVRPSDWFLLTEEGWKKLKTPQEIDDYVSRKLVGPLFIFEDIVKRDEKPVILGSIYNPSRTDQHFVELAMIPQAPNTSLEEHHNEVKPPVPTPVATH